MKKVLKGIAILLGVVILAAGIFALWIHMRGIPSYEVHAPDLKVVADSTMIADGARLSTLVCKSCHLSKGGLMEGKNIDDMPPEFGKVWSSNITRDPKYGAGRYSDGELAYLLRTGIKRDGKYAPPWMPKFPLLSDHDLQSIIAYLRSDAPELAASSVQQPPPQATWLAKFLCLVAFKPFEYPDHEIVAPPVTDKVAYGKYLAVGKVDCFGCHSSSFQTVDAMDPEKTPGFFSGGNQMPGLDGQLVTTRNLTPDKETGIGNWTEEQFIKALKYGQRDGKPALRYPMVPFTAMTDEEASAIFAYLQTIPAIKHDVDAIAAK